MDLIHLETELKKRLAYPYQWGRKQHNDWDAKTNFIYNINNFDHLIKKIESFDKSLKDYALNRWYNFWSAQGVEYMFASHKNVVANKNKFDKLVDFTIDKIPFDHKTSVFPGGFDKSIDYAQNNKRKLIEWLYNNQSQQGRKHLKNRLFIVLYNSNGNHWKLKAELQLLKNVIDIYVNSFNTNRLEVFYFENSKVLSDIIWLKR